MDNWLWLTPWNTQNVYRSEFKIFSILVPALIRLWLYELCQSAALHSSALQSVTIQITCLFLFSCQSGQFHIFPHYTPISSSFPTHLICQTPFVVYFLFPTPFIFLANLVISKFCNLAFGALVRVIYIVEVEAPALMS